MSAEILRRAASLMRERAEQAICPCGGPRCTIEDGGVRRSEMFARFDDWSRVVDHYVGMSPAVAVEMANWLDKAARHASARQDGGMDANESADPRALAVARAYLDNPTT